MTFNTATTLQVTSIIFRTQGDLYYSVADHLETEPLLTRLASPLVALGSLAFELAKVVGLIGESVIKGLTNVFGSPFFKECEFLIGVKQLIVFPFKVTFYTLFFVPATVIGSGVATLSGPIHMRNFQHWIFKKSKALIN